MLQVKHSFFTFALKFRYTEMKIQYNHTYSWLFTIPNKIHDFHSWGVAYLV